FQTAGEMNMCVGSTRWFKIRLRYSASRAGMRLAFAAIASTSRVLRNVPSAGLAKAMVASSNGSRSAGAVYNLTTVCGSWPANASSINTDSKSASVGACVEMMIESGFSCAPVAVSNASYNGEGADHELGLVHRG